MIMLHWAWLFAAFVVGTWMGAFLMALIKAKNPDFHDAEDIQSGDVIVRDPEDPAPDVQDHNGRQDVYVHRRRTQLEALRLPAGAGAQGKGGR